MILAGNAAAELNVASLFVGSNINTNGASGALDLSNYLGIAAVALNTDNGATNTAFQVYLSSSADNNSSNSTNLNITFGNGTNVGAGLQTLGVDTRVAKRYLFANWLISGTGANISADATVIAQAKYKTS